MKDRSRTEREGTLLGDLPVLVLYAALITAGLWGLTQLGAFSRLELAAEDALLEARDGWSASAPAAPERVTVVRITEADLQRFGHPVPDAVLADALVRVLEAKARVVGVDLFRDLAAGAGRERLSALTRRHEEIVFAESLPAPGRSRVPAPEFVARATQRGFGDVLRDDDGRVRRLLLLASGDDGQERVALAFRVSEAYLARQPEPVRRAWIPSSAPGGPELRLGRGRLERLRSGDLAYGPFDDRGYQVRAYFRHGRIAYRTTTLGRLLDGEEDEALFRDRAVLIGTAAVSVGDVFLESTSEDGRAGVEIHALAVDQALRGALEGEAPPGSLPPGPAWTGLFLLACLGAGLGLRAHSRRRALAFALAPFAAPLLLSAASLFAGWRLPAATAAVAMGGAAALGGVERLRRERRDRIVIDRLLESHVSKGVRDLLWRERHSFLRDGRLRARQVTATVLFADLVASSEVAEFTSPQLLLLWLEECMAALGEAVTAHGGMVDDYWGDGLKANFGALLPRGDREDVERDARAAVAAALAMDEALARLNAGWEPRRVGPTRMRIGIHTGPVVVGSLGGLRRHKLTSVGDTVTVAARLESFLREDRAAMAAPGGEGALRFTRILASEETIACLDGRFRTAFVGEESLRGRQAKVCIHRVLGPAEEAERGTLSSSPEVSP